MRVTIPQRIEGHRFDNVPNNDLEQKLTYQQLLNMNHDLAKENMILKTHSRRLGQELKTLHTQFDIRPREDNIQLYNAIEAHPTLHQYQTTLIPLFDAYENKIQEFEHDFETVHQEFFTVQKKFEEICKENEELKSKLTDTKKELIDVYQRGGNQKMHSDFGKIILQQINEKQKVLVELNARLEKDYQKYKAQSERGTNQLQSTKRRFDDNKNRLDELQINLKQLQTENEKLKDRSFQLQVKIKETEAEKRKLEQGHERAQSQNNQLSKEKDMYKNRLEELKARIQRDTNIPTENDQNKVIEQLKTKIEFLQASQGPNDYHKKLQKDYDALLKERQRSKQALDSSKIREDELNAMVSQLKNEIKKMSEQKAGLQKNESQVNKLREAVTEKSKNDLLKIKKQAQEDIEKIQFQLKHKMQMKDKKIAQLNENLDHLKLEKDRIEKQNQIYTKDNKQQKPTKESERALAKMREKMIYSQDLFKEERQMYENDLSEKTNEVDTQKKEIQNKNQQLNKLRAENEQLRKRYEEISRQKQTLEEEFKNVKNQYQDNLKIKQMNFQQKIKEIKSIIQESDNKRKREQERAQQVSRDYKRMLQQLKNAYQARIRELQNQVTQIQHMRTEIITGGQ